MYYIVAQVRDKRRPASDPKIICLDFLNHVWITGRLRVWKVGIVDKLSSILAKSICKLVCTVWSFMSFLCMDSGSWKSCAFAISTARFCASSGSLQVTVWWGWRLYLDWVILFKHSIWGWSFGKKLGLGGSAYEKDLFYPSGATKPHRQNH